MLELNQLYYGDYKEFSKDIPDGSIDLILTDPPYGITACGFDGKQEITAEQEETLKVLGAIKNKEHRDITKACLKSIFELPFDLLGFWREAKSAGWLVRKNRTSGEWEHWCPNCKEEQT